MFQFPGEIKMSLYLHDTKHPVNSIKNKSQFGGGGGETSQISCLPSQSKQNWLVNSSLLCLSFQSIISTL